jgi:hypothetical protein
VRRIPLVLTSAAVVLVVAAVVTLTVPGRSGPSAPLPPSSASPATVARAFLDAAVRRDCHGMRALSTPDDTDWCPASLWTQWTAEGDPTMHSWTALRQVSDPSDPEQCLEYDMRESGLVGMEPGRNTWGLCLRHHAGGWRVSSEGVG